METLEQFADSVQRIINNQPTTINAVGLAKYKNQVYKVTDIISKEADPSLLSQAEKKLYDTFINLDKGTRDSLANAMLTSYFTPEWISKSIINSTQEYFKKENKPKLEILEPSAGTGNLIKDFAGKHNITAVEKDDLTSRFLNANLSGYQGVNIQNIPFENFKTKKEFDLIIGNVPFGSYNVYDRDFDQKYGHLYRGRIQNYFFVKAAQQLAPGGITALITTSSTADLEVNKQLKEYLFEELNLISLHRFDNTAFRDSSTRTVTDLWILQKPLSPKISLSKEEEQVIELSSFDLGDKQATYPSYFDHNQDKLLGILATGRTLFGNTALTLESDGKDYTTYLEGSLKDALNTKGLKNIPLNPEVLNPKLDKGKNQGDKDITEKIKNLYPYAVPGNLIVLDNQCYRVKVSDSNVDHFSLSKMNVDNNALQTLPQILEIRDTYKKMRDHIRNDDLESASKVQEDLNNLYDQFNFFSGELNMSRNAKIINKDFESDLILNLEIINDKVISKSNILTQPLRQKKEKNIEVKTLNDAIPYSLSETGKIDIELISKTIGKPAADWIPEAIKNNDLYINPIISIKELKILDWELTHKESFLSGYIEGKLDCYQNNKFDKAGFLKQFIDREVLDKSIKDLKDAVPLRLEIDDIDPNLGETWIDNSVYEAFGREHFEDDTFKIKFIANFDRFHVTMAYSQKANATYEVQKSRGYVSPKQIFQYALEQNVPEFTKTVYDADGKEVKVVDKKAIVATQESVDKLQAAFSKWIRDKKIHAEKNNIDDKLNLTKQLELKYHLMFNAVVKEKFNASFLKFPDLPSFEPYEHQKEAVWQNTRQNGGIIDHEVGFGKSLTMALSTMTKKKYGIIKKELVAALNANYAKLYEDYCLAYPKGKFLLVTPKDLAPDKKQNTFYKIANNDYDAIITAHSCLMKFPTSPYTEKDIYREIIEDTRATIEDPDSDKFLGKRDRQRLERKLENAEAKYQKAKDVINSKKENGTLIFEDLGIDSLTVDESQYFKNLSYNTRHTRVAGLGTQKETQKTSNLLSYVRSIQKQQKGDKGITFASGTTISNSITELYLILKYLRPDFLKEKGIHTFDQWARQFARKSTEYEESVGGKIKMKERFREFVKVPELAKMYNDIAHYADFNSFKIERPLAVHKLISIDPHPKQNLYFEKIRKFANTKDASELIGVQNTSNAQKAYGLIATSQGRKAALDLRLISPHFQDHPNSKVNVMANNAQKIYNDFNKDKGTQLIFCDQGTPTSKNFNLYAAMKDALIERGIPKDEIAFIHNLKVKDHDKVNSGKIRVVIGSTTKMGVGVNVQQKLVAMHHMDFPWRPTDLTQRNGRGERKGNTVLPKYDNKIPTFYYATKRSLDAYTLDLLNTKARFIKQLKTASLSIRKLDEGEIGSDGSLSLESFKAIVSDKPLMTEKLKLTNQLSKLLDQKKAFTDKNRSNAFKIRSLTEDKNSSERILTKLKDDFKKAQPLIKSFENGSFRTTINDFENSKSFGAHLRKYLLSRDINKKPKVELAPGFNLKIQIKNPLFEFSKDNYRIVVETPNDHLIGYKSKTFTKDDEKNGLYPVNALKRLPELIDNYQKRFKEASEDLQIYEDAQELKFDKEDLILDCKKKIAEIEVELNKEFGHSEEDQDQSNNKGKDQNGNDGDDFENDNDIKPRGPRM